MIFSTSDSDTQRLQHVMPGAKVYRAGKLKAVVTTEPEGLHVSISHPTRLPSWEELHAARYQLMPDNMQVAMILPPRSEYVNIHQFCHHLWEIKNGPQTT